MGREAEAHNHTGFQWQKEAAGSGIGSLTASPHWSHKFGKLHGNLISAAALCSPAEPRPGAGRHMCDDLPTDTRRPVSEGDRGKSLLVPRLSEPEKELWPQGPRCFSQYRLCMSWGGIIWGAGPVPFHFPSHLSLSFPPFKDPAQLLLPGYRALWVKRTAILIWNCCLCSLVSPFFRGWLLLPAPHWAVLCHDN